MKLINENLKKAGYFNALLIVIGIVLKALSFLNNPIYIQIDAVVCIIAMVFGLFYSLNGYKKDAAKYYKAFMYLYLFSSLFSFIASISGDKTNIIIVITNVVILLSAAALAFAKDLGESKSNTLSLVILALNIVKMFVVISTTGVSLAVTLHFSNLVLACILCVFVSAKYADKQSRGAI